MTMKLRAASGPEVPISLMARTDARASEGLVPHRSLQGYIDMSADMIFPEALQGWEEYEKVGSD